MIGFAFGNENTKKTEETSVPAVREEKAVISLVKVVFGNSKTALDYYNDKFDLHEGDRVFVEGSNEGKIGTVVSVSTKFCINLKKYRRVVAHPTISFDGKFIRMNDKMVGLGSVCPTPDMMAAWLGYCPSVDELVCGEPFSVSLDGFGSEDGIEKAVFGRALEYCQTGKVLYIRVENGRGTAFVNGKNVYKVEFTLGNNTVENIVCDCPYPYFCKHAVAVVITLKMMLSEEQIESADSFTAIDRNFFWETISEGCDEITV